jgi:predicted nucleotidyltransferase
MNGIEDTFLQKIFERSKAKIEFAALFGSYKNGKNDFCSDVDVFIVCENEGATYWKILNELSNLSSRIPKIHPTVITSDVFWNRLLNLDYLLVSILDDSIFLFGDRNSFIEAKQKISTVHPSIESIRHNQNMAEKVRRYANDCFYRAQNSERHLSAISYKRYTRRDLQLMGMKNYHLALGYFLASNEMRNLDHAVSLKHLINSETGAVMNDIISLEKRISRRNQLTSRSRTHMNDLSLGFDFLNHSTRQ